MVKNNKKGKTTTSKEREGVTKEKTVIKAVTEEEIIADSDYEASLGKKIFNAVFWVAIVCLFIIWIVDFSRAKTENNPVFCLKEKTYEDKAKEGTVKECIGLGYKVFKHTKDKEITYQFRPIFSNFKE